MQKSYSKSNKILVVGITGGIGSGKTTVSKIIRELGSCVLITDDIAKELMENDSVLKSKIINEFGKNAYISDGTLNRQFLSTLVFGTDNNNKIRLDNLNRIVHPRVIDYLINKIGEYAESGEKLVFIESALIYEAQLEWGFDYIIVVDSNAKKCVERTVLKTGLSIAEVEKRIKSQLPPAEKRAAADFVIENNGTTEELHKSVQMIYAIVKSLSDNLDK